MACLGLVLAISPADVRAQSRRNEVEFAVLRDTNAAPVAAQRHAEAFSRHVTDRTSVDVGDAARVVAFGDRSVLSAPLLYWRVETPRELGSEELAELRRFVARGGLLIVEDVSRSDVFERSFRRGMATAFPRGVLHALAATHTILHSYYLLDAANVPPVEVVDVRGRAAVLYTKHDLGAASESIDAMTRERAARFIVNVVLYALCLDYKDDQVHAPFLMRRRGALP
jgi:hypothetical protein